jgi:hypothetical protein
MTDTNGSSIVMGSGDVAGLMVFLDWLVQKHLATSATVAPLRSAAKQVFATVGDANDIDVRTFNAEDYFARFQVAAQSNGRITPDSVRAYRNRFLRALKLYTDYLETGDTPKLTSRSAATVRTRREKQSPPSANAKAESMLGSVATEQTETTSSNMISFPFPLESGDVANLRLPKRLEKRDATRLNAFINALVFEQPKQLNPGPSADEIPPQP